MGGGDQLVHRLVELADLEMDRGAPQAALPYLREAWRLEPTSKHPRTRVRTALCELRLRLWATPPNRSNDKSSADLLRDATAWSTALRDPGLVLRALTLVGTASADAAPEAAHATAMEALEMARRLPPPGLRLQLDLALGLVRLLRKVGEADAAQELARAVATEVEGIAATLSEASLVATYRNAPLAKRVLFEAAKKN